MTLGKCIYLSETQYASEKLCVGFSTSDPLSVERVHSSVDLSGLSSHPAVPEDAQEPWGGVVTALCCVLHQPGCAWLLLHVSPGGEV